MDVHRNPGSYHPKFLLLLPNFNKNESVITNFSKTPRYVVHENFFKGPQVTACDKIKRQIHTLLIFIYETNTCISYKHNEKYGPTIKMCLWCAHCVGFTNEY